MGGHAGPADFATGLRRRVAAPEAVVGVPASGAMSKGGGERARLPTALVALFLCAFSVLQAMAAIASKEGGTAYPYKVIAATLLSEVFKVVLSLGCLGSELWTYRNRGEADKFGRAVFYTGTSVLAAAVPGVAYQVLNNLNFVTLYFLDAPTFQILGNLKIVATGVAGRAGATSLQRERAGRARRRSERPLRVARDRQRSPSRVSPLRRPGRRPRHPPPELTERPVARPRPADPRRRRLPDPPGGETTDGCRDGDFDRRRRRRVPPRPRGRRRGGKLLIQRRFNVGVLEATPERKASTLRVRPER